MKWIKKHKYAFLSFSIPLFVMIFIMVVTESAPFGENSFMIVDALHQYLPFFADYQEKLKNMGSLFYSWNGGLGYNFFSLWAYYLSSPFNLIIVFLSRQALIPVLNFIIVLKFALCSLAGFSYFTYREGKESIGNVALGLCYCFSSYMTGYYWNVMWLEVMILLPVILIGMDRLMKKKGWKLYTISLFAAMFCNYYMSFMVCLFLVLWYGCDRFDGIKDFIRKGLRFAGASLLAAAMAAVVLLPAYQGLMATSSAHLSFPQWEAYGQAVELFSTHLAAMEPYNMSVDDGLGNLYCGILPLLLGVLYVLDRQFSWKEKLKKLLLLGFLAVSFQIEILNYVWHGFHNQYGIPNRFAFVYIFLILILAWEQWNHMEWIEVKRWKIVVSLGILLACVGLLYQYGELESPLPLVLSAGILLVYGVLLMMRKRQMKMILSILVIAEMCANGIYGFYCSGQMDAAYYFAETEEVQKLKEQVKPSAEERMELLNSKMLDESIWHTLPNATMFGSTALGDTVDAMDQLGFYTGVNEYLYEGGTPVTDLLLGIKSILVRNGDRMYRTGYEYLYSIENVSLYQNSLPTAIGYWMDEKVGRWNYDDEDPFQVQNDLMALAYDCPKLYEEVEVEDPVGNDCEITSHQDGSYFVKAKKQHSDNVTFVFNIEEAEDLYLHFDCGNVDHTIIYVNGREQQSGRLNSQVVSIGNVEEGDTVSVQLQLKDGEESTGTITMRAASLNKEAFRFLKKSMRSSRFEMLSQTSRQIKGIIHAKENGRVFFSIPYDEGWKVTMDGKEVKKVRMADGFLAVDVENGEYALTLTYTPPGFSLGWKLSTLGWLIFAGLLFSKKRFRKSSYLTKENVV